MRIVQIIQGVDNPSAGPTYSVARLTQELARLGDDASILTLGATPAVWPFLAPLDVRRTSTTLLGGVSVPLMREIRSLARTPGILHGHGIWRTTNLFPLAVSRGTPARLVCSPRGTLSAWSMHYKSLVKQPFWHLLQRPALTRCHCLHATATGEYDDIRRVGLPAPVAILPNGIDIPDIPPDTRRTRRVVFLGRIDPVKGLDILLPGWSAVAEGNPAWELLIAGPLEGEYAATVQGLARRLRAPRVRFLGQTLGAAKRSLLASASLFVLPSYSENFGIVVAEALAHGVPVITTTATPWAEVRARGCGWCVAPRQEALREALLDAVRLPLPELHAMGQAGRDWMRRDYAWPQVVARMRRTYEWLLLGGSAPPWVALD